MALSLANQISRDTSRYNPEIERLDNGDIIFHWRIWQDRGPFRKITIERLADLTGIDEELFYRESGFIKLHVPAEIAEYMPAADAATPQDSPPQVDRETTCLRLRDIIKTAQLGIKISAAQIDWLSEIAKTFE